MAWAITQRVGRCQQLGERRARRRGRDGRRKAPDRDREVGGDQERPDHRMYQRHRRKRLAKLRADGRARTASTRFHARLRRRRRGQSERAQGQAGGALLLPQGRHPGCTKQACAIRDDWSAFEQVRRGRAGREPRRRPTRTTASATSSACRSRCWPTRITPSPRPTAPGARRRTTARPTTASSARGS